MRTSKRSQCAHLRARCRGSRGGRLASGLDQPGAPQARKNGAGRVEKNEARGEEKRAQNEHTYRAKFGCGCQGFLIKKLSDSRNASPFSSRNVCPFWSRKLARLVPIFRAMSGPILAWSGSRFGAHFASGSGAGFVASYQYCWQPTSWRRHGCQSVQP